MIIAATMTDETWRRAAVRRFSLQIAILTVLFVASELAAALRLVPHLEPVSLHTLITNPLFAIGFGGPLVLHLTSLPRLRELAATLATGIVLSLAVAWLARETTAMQWVIGLGLASTLVLAVRAARRQGDALLFLLPSLVTLLFTLEAAMFLNVISNVHPLTYDGLAFAADTAFGSAISFDIGRAFARWPLLAMICTGIYLAPPPGLMFVYALQVKRQHPAVDVVTLLVVMGVIGYSSYFLYPVCGPKFAFPSFPLDPPQVTSALIPVPPAPRNGMPSLHMASALIAYLHARRYGRIATAVAAVFVAGTFLATMGTGEHYFIDLLVALPFTIAVDALLTRRWLRGAINATLFLGWLWLLHAPLLPMVAWVGLLVTVAAAVTGSFTAARSRRPSGSRPGDRPPGRAGS